MKVEFISKVLFQCSISEGLRDLILTVFSKYESDDENYRKAILVIYVFDADIKENLSENILMVSKSDAVCFVELYEYYVCNTDTAALLSEESVGFKELYKACLKVLKRNNAAELNGIPYPDN